MAYTQKEALISRLKKYEDCLCMYAVMKWAPDIPLSAKNKMEKSVYYIPLFIYGGDVCVYVCVCVCAFLLFLCKKTPNTSTAMEAVIGRILGWLVVFCPPSIYALYHLLLLSVGRMGGCDDLLLA